MSSEDIARGREPAVRTVAMPADTNPTGDIFGGWLLAQMDIAGGSVAFRRAKGRVVTVAVDGMTFHRPVFVGDLVTCFAEVVRVGNTSLAVHIETIATREATAETVKVTEGTFTYVAVDQDRRPRPLPKGERDAPPARTRRGPGA